MPEQNEKYAERRSFLKGLSLFGFTAVAATVGGYGSTLLGKEKESTITSLTDAAEVVTDASKGVHFRLRPSQHFRLANPVNAVDGQRIIWEIIQDGLGGHQLTLDDKFVFGADLTKAELSTAAHKRDYLTAIYNQSADQWHVVAFIRGF